MITHKFNSSVFPNGTRNSKRLNLLIFFHLPNQLISSGNFGKYTWPKRNQARAYTMFFQLQQIEIIERRNKRKDPCIPKQLNYDQFILDDRLEKIGCKTPYQRTTRNLKICGSRNEKMYATVDFFSCKKPIQPCTGAGAITFTYDEFNLSPIMEADSQLFHIMIIYPHQYKEIVMVRAVDIETVIANAGGYIGLFLGKEIAYY